MELFIYLRAMASQDITRLVTNCTASQYTVDGWNGEM